MITAWHNIDFAGVLEKNKHAYHYHYFCRYADIWANAWKNRHQLQTQCPTKADLDQKVLNNLINDHQYWHLGHTLTWTPFKNINLVKILLQCDVNDLVSQFVDGQLTKNIIAHYEPQLTKFVSDYKNYNSQQHLAEFYDWHQQH